MQATRHRGKREMTFAIILLGVSLFSAMVVIASVMLASQANRDREVGGRYDRHYTLQRTRRRPSAIADALD
jgi:hypothetical protein